VIVHNRATRERILASRPDARVVEIPHHLSLDALPAGLDRAAARAALGIAPGVPVVASFGFMTPQKRLGVSLRAFAALRRTVPDAVFLVAGELAPDLRLDEDLAGARDAPGAAGVRLLGRVDLPTFLAAMLACDVAVNLRYPSGGETSGTLIRLLGLGKPVVVSDHGSFAEIPDGCCAKVPLDGDEEAVLTAVLERLCQDPELRRAMGECARREMERHHTLAGSAAAYAAVVRRAVAEGWQPLPAVPPLAPYPRTDFGSALAGVVGAHLLDLGVEESDQDLLAAIAPAFVELGLDRG
jgi:glycosyltransferase involved in cell wall biosynthesis